MNSNARSFPRRLPLALTSAVVALAFAVAAHAQAPAPSAGRAAEPGAPATSPSAAPGQAATSAASSAAAPAAPVAAKRALSPMLAEMHTFIEAQDLKLAELNAKQAAAHTNDEGIALQQQIQALKLDTEVSLLRIQATYARREGRAQDADRIESVVRDMLSPPRIASPAANRPIPVADTAKH